MLAARIQDLLRDVERVRIPRLLQMCERLRAGASGWDDAALAAAMSSLHSAARELHFTPLRQGRMARLLGRHRVAEARFVATCEHITACASQVKGHAATLASTSGDSTSAMKHALLEIATEVAQFEAAIDLGVTWLQDMCTQLADARTHGVDDPRIASLAEAAQLFTQQFKRLQSASAMAQDVALRGNTVLQRRTALLAQVRIDLQVLDETWLPRLAQVLDELKAGRPAGMAIPKALEAHEELLKRLSAALDACGALQQQDPLLVQQLALWQDELEGRDE